MFIDGQHSRLERLYPSSTFLRSAKVAQAVHNVFGSTGHPAKLSYAVELALAVDKGFQLNDILPPQFVGLEDLTRRGLHVKKKKAMS